MKGIEKHIEELEKQIDELINNLDNCSKEEAFEISYNLDKVIDDYMKNVE